MDNIIGNIPSPIVVNTTQFTPSASMATKPEVPFLPIVGGNATNFDPQAAQQQRLQTVQNAAQSVAASFVVSDHTFTIFKDTTGQYITRFISLRDGSITYIPEPNSASVTMLA